MIATGHILFEDGLTLSTPSLAFLLHYQRTCHMTCQVYLLVVVYHDGPTISVSEWPPSALTGHHSTRCCFSNKSSKLLQSRIPGSYLDACIDCGI